MAVHPTRPDRLTTQDHDDPDGPEARRRALERVRAAQRTALVVGALVVVTVLGSALAGPFVPQQRPGAEFVMPSVLLPDRDQPTPAPTREAVAEAVPPDGAPPWLVVLAFCLLLVLLAVLGRTTARIVRRWLEQQRELAVDDGLGPGQVLRGDVLDLAQPALSAGVADAVQALARDLPPGDAVVAAWVALEQSAERSGVVRDRAQTPTEFTLELLDETRADPAASRTLLDLYLVARFSEHPVTAEHVSRARAALHEISRGLRARRAADDATSQDDEPVGDATSRDDEPLGRPSPDEDAT